MKLIFKVLVVLLFFSKAAYSQNTENSMYFEKYKNLAISEMERTGVPASITLAQAVLESNAGKSYLARKGRNHFGLKCHGWKGKRVYRKDDDYGADGKLKKSCFRAYRTVKASYINHSDFLRSPKNQRYEYLFRYEPTNYKAWARGLQRAGYATSATYGRKLIDIIEKYRLYEYDRMTSNDVLLADVEILNTLLVNDVKLVLANEGDTPTEIEYRTGISAKRILKYNENIDSLDQRLSKDTRVFLQPKKNFYRERKKWHYIKQNETMFDISQLYGVKLSKLYKKNRLNEGEEPVAGEKIMLRGLFKVKTHPKLRAKNSTKPDDKHEVPVLIEHSDEVEFENEEIDVTPETNDENNLNESEWMDELETETKPETEINEEELEEQPLESTENKIEIETEPETKIEPETKTETEAEEAVITPELSEIYHTVVRNDTLYSLARKYGTTVNAIKSLNGLRSNLIKKGQRLRIK